MNKRLILVCQFILIALPIFLLVNAANNEGQISLSKTATKQEDSRNVDVSLKVAANEIEEPNVDIVFVLDGSTSMRDDADDSGISRLDASKAAMISLVDSIFPDGDNNNIKMGIVTFGTKLLTNKTMTSLSSDKDNLKSFIEGIEEPGNFDRQQTNVQAGLMGAQQLLSGSTSDKKYVILLSDGGPTVFTGTDGSTCGNGSGDYADNGRGCDGLKPSEAALSVAKSLKESNYGAEIITIGFSEDVDENALNFLHQVSSSTSQTNIDKYNYFATNTSSLNQAMSNIASTINGIVATNGKITDIIPSSFTITDESVANLKAKYGENNVTISKNDKGETVLNISVGNITSTKQAEVNYTITAKDDHYGAMYTNTQATLTADAASYNEVYPDGKINLTFEKPIVAMQMVTKDDNYGEVKKGQSLTINTDESILNNDSQTKHTDDNKSTVTNKVVVVDNSLTCGSVRVNNDGTFTFNATKDCSAGEVSFDYYVESTVNINGQNTTVKSNTSTVKLTVANEASEYTVKYLDNTTKEPLANEKVVSKDVNVLDDVTEDAIDIPGYEVVGDSSQTIEIQKDTTKNIIIFYYKKVKANLKDPTITKEGTDEITSLNDKLDYTIKYSTTIDKYIGTATITIVDTLPYPIDEDNSNLDGGIYDKDKHTITWTINKDVDTYNGNTNSSEVTLNITKTISVKYIYPEFDGTEEKIDNMVTGNTSVDTTDDKSSTTHEYTNIEVYGNLIVKHIYMDEGKEVVLETEPTKNEKVGTSYTTSEKDFEGFELVKTPSNSTGKYTEGTTTVVYEYKLIDPEITNTSLTKTDIDEKQTIESVDQEIGYLISHKTTIDKYKGTATITIVDKLPYAIDEDKLRIETSDTTKCSYNSSTLEITCVNTVDHINTFINDKPREITTNIKLYVVYKNLDATKDKVTNKVTSSVDVATLDPVTNETEKDIPVSIKGKVITKYEDVNGEELTTPTTSEGRVGSKYETKQLSFDGYEFVRVEGNATGTYQVNDTEVTYVYERLGAEPQNPVLSKRGPNQITSSANKAIYQINYSAVTENYVGKLYLTIVDKLPYAIDEENSILDGGTYNEANHTITWTLEYDCEHELEINVTKNITLAYKNIDATASSFTNNIKATLTDELNDTYEKESSWTTDININGTVTAKYVDTTGKELVKAVSTNGKVGTEYKTSAKNINGYTLKEIKGNETGKYTEGTTTVTYIYDRTPVKLSNENINKKVQKDPITSANQLVTYDLSYNITVADYIGYATFEMVDHLPYAIDTENSNLAGGVYDPNNLTITWTEKYYVDTYTNGSRKQSVSKTISIKYLGIPSNDVIKNSVSGRTYTETGNSKGVNASAKIESQIKGDLKVEYIGIDDNGKETILDEYNKTDYVGNTYETKAKEFEGYDLIETPDNSKGKYTEGTTTIVYYYKLKEAKVTDNEISKTSVNTIVTSANDIFEYIIKYSTTIIDYIGKATVEIVDYLPFEIDLSKSSLDGGIYDKNNKTITWTYEFDVNTYQNINNIIDIEKRIRLAYLNLNTTSNSVTNKVKAELTTDRLPVIIDEADATTTLDIAKAVAQDTVQPASILPPKTGNDSDNNGIISILILNIILLGTTLYIKKRFV